MSLKMQIMFRAIMLSYIELSVMLTLRLYEKKQIDFTQYIMAKMLNLFVLFLRAIFRASR